MGPLSGEREKQEILPVIRDNKLESYVILHGPQHDQQLDAMFEQKAPPDESPINIQQLISFQKSLTMTPQNIRESIRPLSWTAQMKKVIDELDIRPQHTILEK